MAFAFQQIQLYDTTLTQKSWDLKNKNEVKKLKEIIKEIPKPTKTYPWIIFNRTFYYSINGGTIIDHDFMACKPRKKLVGHTASLCRLYREKGKNHLVSVDITGVVKVWDKDGKRVASNNT